MKKRIITAETGKRKPLTPSGQFGLPVATFKNSLRLWQARWKAQQAAGLVEAGTPEGDVRSSSTDTSPGD